MSRKRAKNKKRPAVNPISPKPVIPEEIGIDHIADISLASALALHFKNEDAFHGVILSDRTFALFQYALYERTELMKLLMEAGVLTAGLRVNKVKVSDMIRQIKEFGLQPEDGVVLEAEKIKSDSETILIRLQEIESIIETGQWRLSGQSKGLQDGEIELHRQEKHEESETTIP